MNTAFYIAAAAAIAATFLVVIQSHAVHALLYFIVSLLATGVMFFLLGAPFAAAVVIIINAGAIMVLLVFVMMMLNVRRDETWPGRSALNPRVWLGPAILTLILLVELGCCLILYPSQKAASEVIEPKQVSLAMFGPYMIGVELASMLLLAGIIGAYHLGRGAFRGKEKIDHD
jgi:NADH-quinone oxidoreductase subunit J